MIFSIKKALFNQIEDVVIKPYDESFTVKVAKLSKGYFLYGKDGEQVGQIIFEAKKAVVVSPDSAALEVTLNSEQNNFIISDGAIPEDDFKTINNLGEKRISAAEYMIYGKPREYRYDIYEKLQGKKAPIVSANIINDMQNTDNYKIRVQGQDNILKIIMICLAIDKLNFDPESNY